MQEDPPFEPQLFLPSRVDLEEVYLGRRGKHHVSKIDAQRVWTPGLEHALLEVLSLIQDFDQNADTESSESTSLDLSHLNDEIASLASGLSHELDARAAADLSGTQSSIPLHWPSGWGADSSGDPGVVPQSLFHAFGTTWRETPSGLLPPLSVDQHNASLDNEWSSINESLDER
uniref:Uncharacterized protein n=1 Tax=Mycena chlorophos TaxID=658473 RepID=A0ABQ0KY41_MYCCL|nr:predicted protein [Mycena chlorophos]